MPSGIWRIQENKNPVADAAGNMLKFEFGRHRWRHQRIPSP
jgi:hypothetical protein